MNFKNEIRSLKMHIIFQSKILKNPIELLVFGKICYGEKAARCISANNGKDTK